MIVLIDNYDSFTYNLYQYLCELGAEVEVVRNDRASVHDIRMMQPERLIISPGPCTPQEAGISVPLIQEMAGQTPILGVCLGHQAIGAAFGGEVVRATTVMHGKTSQIEHNGRDIFAGLPNPFTATRYHSLIVAEDSLPATLEITARSEDGTIMGLRHRECAVYGVQFHPESILTTGGHRLLANFLGHEQPAVTERALVHGY
ncbi:MAG TPA: aminodeoxychorismate/anthranilate synthase component II [Thermomicrobiales bacterium]|jgi:anthranilate synthase component 2|nr:anthranilate/aminodeoxychorismate synthase component II [Chloroflexota bacterium]HQX62015.1 aminodeoxychorismate/anthranilate synthase component II [Thermomicrobiales bacterium]HBY45102.1 anthranilate/aminodeoxychorismate synthase component II [Chloroflexota bacterium]HCG29228.1 anthranilate/aminodeoxychorismate synthase component II [Chloroflexota bacterium]HQZ90151.1 aminodeoxychorismate/anthranilate synthase component II [Thermomicrobiales bacterium]